MKRLMSITAVLTAVTCHSAYGQLDSIGGAAQGAAGQVGSAADSATDQVQSQTGDIQTGASATTQAEANLGAGTGTSVDANANVDAQADVNATPQSQINRGARNLNRGLNAIGGIVPPIPQQARTGNDAPRDARWRFTQRNGQWWYYSPQNQWMVRQNDEWQKYDDSYQPLAGRNNDQGVYSSGYRGDMSNQGQYSNQQAYQSQGGHSGAGQMQMTAHSGPVYMLHYDQSGREFICVHGQRVYFDDQSNRNMEGQSDREEADTQGEESGDERYQAQRQDLDNEEVVDPRPLTETQSDRDNGADASATVPPPAPTAAAPATEADTQSSPAGADASDAAAEAASGDASGSQSDSEDPESDDDDSDDA